MGGQIPYLSDLTTRVAYYRFASSDRYIDSRQGIRGVLGYKITSLFQIDLETSYDNQRKWVYFGGVTVGYSFDRNHKSYSSLTWLEQKMNTIPIRDIDAVVGDGNSIDILDQLSIDNMSENTTILIVDIEQNSLIMLDMQEGNLVVNKSKLSAENMQISNLINSYKEKDIIVDDKVVTLMFMGEDIIEVNEFEYSNSGLNIKHRKQHNLSSVHKDIFINMINLVSTSSANLRWGISHSKIQKIIEQQKEIERENARLLEEISQKEISIQRLYEQSNTASMREQELTEELDRLQQQAHRERINLESRIREIQDISQEQKLLIEERLRRLQEASLIEQQKLKDQIILERTRLLEQQSKIEQHYSGEHERLQSKHVDLENELRILSERAALKEKEMLAKLKEQERESLRQQALLETELKKQTEESLREQILLKDALARQRELSTSREREITMSLKAQQKTVSVLRQELQRQALELEEMSQSDTRKIEEIRTLKDRLISMSDMSARQLELERMLESERKKFRTVQSDLDLKISGLSEELARKQEKLDKFSGRIDRLVHDKLAKVVKSMESEFKRKHADVLRRTRALESKYSGEIRELSHENQMLRAKLSKFYSRYRAADFERPTTPTALASSHIGL